MAYTAIPVATVTASGSTNTKGSYTELTAATPADSSRLHLHVLGTDTDNGYYLIDLSTGAGGAEVVQVANMPIHTGDDLYHGYVVTIPLDVSSGTRLAARCQCSVASAVAYVGATHEERDLSGGTSPVTYGAVTATSRGTTVATAGSIDVKGTYVELTASTTAQHGQIGVFVTVTGVTAGGATLNNDWRMDIATGAAAAEVVAIPDVGFRSSVTGDTISPKAMVFVAPVASGTRLAARQQVDALAAVDENVCVTLIGMGER